MTRISRDIFEQQRRPRFGKANPERMQCAFWEWMGYAQDRRPGFTSVHSVDVENYRITGLQTSGSSPSWIFDHTASASGDGTIAVLGGQIVELRKGKKRFRRNNEEFSLSLETGIWTQTTNRNWPQWSITQEDEGLFVLDHGVRVKDLVPPGVEGSLETDESYREAKFLLRGVPIRVIVGVNAIEILAEGDLPEEFRSQVPEVFRKRVETLSKKKCVVE